MHSRKVGRDNSFTYKILFLRLPLETLNQFKRGFLLGVNKLAILSVFRKDHGTRENISQAEWFNETLEKAGFDQKISSVQLMTLPRVLGYAFKPVSFWFCLNQEKQPIAVLAEVNNTFGETHSYLCSHKDSRPIQSGEILTADKLFHVSPFIQRDGYYEFKFSYKTDLVLIGINHFDDTGQLRLVTTLKCQVLPSKASRLGTFFQGVTSLAVFPLILWQALKIWLKGISYVSKPSQKAVKLSQTKTS